MAHGPLVLFCVGHQIKTLMNPKRFALYGVNIIKISCRIVWGVDPGSRTPIEATVSVGDTVMVTVSKITGYTGVVTETMKLDIKFLLNGKVVINVVVFF